MKTTAILNQILIIFGLVAVMSLATSSQDVKNELTSMDSTPFGHRLLDMIQVQMNTNSDPVKTLLDLLNKLKASLLEERTKVEDANANQEADCKSTLPQLKSEIKMARRKKVYAENSKAAKKEELSGVELLLNENQKVLDKVNDYIKTVTNERDQDRKRYEDAISDIARIRDALKRAKDILGQINEKGDFSLVQMKDDLHSMNFDYEYVKGIHKMALYFVEMAKAEPKELEHLFNVIDKIVAQLGENEFQLTQAESTKTKVFEAQMNQLNALQFEASAKVNNVKQTQQDLNNGILTIKNDVTHYDKTIELKSKEYADKKAQCRENKSNHKTRTNDIASQLDVIDQAIILIKENVEPLKEYVAHRDDAKL